MSGSRCEVLPLIREILNFKDQDWSRKEAPDLLYGNSSTLEFKIVSNLIVSTTYLFTNLLWFYYFMDLEVQSELFYFPYGILVLAFLFFGNKVVLGLLFAQLLLYFFTLNYDLSLPFKGYFIISIIQLACMPTTLYILGRFNYTVGAGLNCKLNKTNIYHVLLISFLSTILNGILLIFYSLFFVSQINLLLLAVGCFFGSTVLIVSAKLLLNIPYILKSIFKTT